MAARTMGITRDILIFEGKEPRAYWRRFAMLLTLSTIIATMGLYRNSSAVVIAAMLIAPLMTPILGVAAAMVMGWSLRSLQLLMTVLFAAICTVGVAYLIMEIADTPRGILIPPEVLARTDPGIEELIVALASGVAGAYVQIQKKELALLPGAAIGVSLVPPLGAAGILLYYGEASNAAEAILLFLTNLGAIVVSACAVYLLAGMRPFWQRRARRIRQFSLGFALTMLLLGLIGLELARTTYSRYLETRLEQRVAEVILGWAGDTSLEILRVNVDSRAEDPIVELWLIVDIPTQAAATVDTYADLIPAQLDADRLRSFLLAALGSDYKVVVRWQTRLAGTIDLDTGDIEQAPQIQDVEQ